MARFSAMSARDGAMHRTQALDHGIVLEEEIEMVLVHYVVSVI